MEAVLNSGLHAAIAPSRLALVVSDASGSFIASLPAPPNAAFYQFATHVTHGECPIVSFDPEYKINGWPDWYYLVSADGKSIERLNPWR